MRLVEGEQEQGWSCLIDFLFIEGKLSSLELANTDIVVRKHR